MARFSRALDYPVEKISLLVRDVGAQVKGDGVAQQETRDMGGRRYVQLAADNVAAGRAVGVQPERHPGHHRRGGRRRPSGTTASQAVPADRLGLASAGVGGLLLVLGLAYPVLRRRQRARRGAPAAGGATSGTSWWPASPTWTTSTTPARSTSRSTSACAAKMKTRLQPSGPAGERLG